MGGRNMWLKWQQEMAVFIFGARCEEGTRLTVLPIYASLFLKYVPY